MRLTLSDLIQSCIQACCGRNPSKDSLTKAESDFLRRGNTGVAHTDSINTALGHDLVHHDAQAVTCTEVGWEAYDTCSRCDYTTYKEIPALAHNLVHHDAQAATCTEVGWDAYDTCSRCDYSTCKEIPALGHDLKEMEKVEPTCTATGTEAYWICQRDGCGKLFSDAEGKTR